MPKKVQTLTVTLKATRDDGPPVDVDTLVAMLAEEWDGFEVYVEGDDEGSSVILDVVMVEATGKTVHERI
ncbi:hypothetical protein [Streptomyces sp. NPDC056401]|uniref:hypothetical protein n=1 Tax=Streptomyces sp. NPDC056401 TaxID=3345809 RepID=UPI0035D85A9C